MKTELVEHDDEFRRLLKCDKVFYSSISRVSQEFYDVYVRKCNEWHEAFGFFEPLYAYLIGYGFSKGKCNSYLNAIRPPIIEYLRKKAKSLQTA